MPVAIQNAAAREGALWGDIWRRAIFEPFYGIIIKQLHSCSTQASQPTPVILSFSDSGGPFSKSVSQQFALAFGVGQTNARAKSPSVSGPGGHSLAVGCLAQKIIIKVAKSCHALVREGLALYRPRPDRTDHHPKATVTRFPAHPAEPFVRMRNCNKYDV